jgi:hypothetical protein
VEATQLRVSCNASGENGTTPRTIPETPPPPLNPALAGFVDRYRSALSSGAAREVGRGSYRGHDVVWLEFAANSRTERVAVDAQSFKPIAISDDGSTLEVQVAEAVPFNPDLFTKPATVVTQRGSTVTSTTALSPSAATSLLGGRGLWLGRAWDGLTLTRISREERTIGFGPEHDPGHADVIRFTYAPRALTPTSVDRSRVEIYESTSCIMSFGWECNARDPALSGQLKVFGGIGLLRSEGLYVSIWHLTDSRTSLDLARALTPLSG